ncbi:MAG: hypothetical protein WBY53_04470 [Acidobacteriaceae bacterium]
MLDIHAPHETTHTWKDFFIHVATICVGLLIAIALEQSVEYIHHRHQVADARTRLAQERDRLRRACQDNMVYAANMQAELAADMALLYQREANPRTPLQGRLHYDWFFFSPPDGAWQAAREDGVLPYLSPQELDTYTFRYYQTHLAVAAGQAYITALEIAGATARRAPNADLSPADVHDLIVATSEAQGRLLLVQKYTIYLLKLGLADKPTGTDYNRPIAPGEVDPDHISAQPRQ